MPSIVSKNVRYFYEEDSLGNKILRHILIGSSRSMLLVPAEGVTIDVVPDNSVGSEQIKDNSVAVNDLTPEARERMLNEFAANDDVKSVLGL